MLCMCGVCVCVLVIRTRINERRTLNGILRDTYMEELSRESEPRNVLKEKDRSLRSLLLSRLTGGTVTGRR